MLLIFLTNLVPRLGRGWVGVGGGGEGGEIVQSTCEASYPSVPSVCIFQEYWSGRLPQARALVPYLIKKLSFSCVQFLTSTVATLSAAPMICGVCFVKP